MNEAYLIIGGNIGDRMLRLQQAADAIRLHCGRVISSSSVYETAAWGKEDQQDFLNQVLLIHTEMNAQKLLEKILSIEVSLGRARTERYGPRTIDIDILLYNDAVISEEGLKVPHPRMPQRRFVLAPLNEIASGLVHPVLKKSIAQLLEECPDPLQVHKIS